MNFEPTVLREIVGELKKSRLTRRKVWSIVKKVCKGHNLSGIPTNVQILQACNEQEREKLHKFLFMKPVRTISGVTVITVVAKPVKCVWSKCVYCPKGDNAPSSYTGKEPAVQRGINNRYDPFLQTKDRLRQYNLLGHDAEKAEVIILGGTFLALENEYQEWFVKRIFDGLNGRESTDLDEAKKLNETATHRCIGMCIETRPDYCRKQHIKQLLRLGATRVEIGVQSIYPDVLEAIKRGHTVEVTIEAIRLAKDAGLKVAVHVMPGLPGSSLQKDLDMFKTLFTDPRFMPDELKIYPVQVLKGTELYDVWNKKKYTALTDEQARDFLVKAKEIIPPFARIRRVLRDIPATVVAGPKKSNMRELVQAKMKEEGIRCRCTRCREVGHAKKMFGIAPRIGDVKLIRRDYEASEGKEVFLSFEDVGQDILISLLRLRMPSHKADMKEIVCKPSAIIREIHTFGPALPIGKHPVDEWQHRGYGKKLLKEAERIAKDEFKKEKILVISGVGARQYFLKQGYKYDGSYVSKLLV